jgi:alcohol dehydrogenase class IV
MVPHGISVIVNAPAVFRFTGPACPERHLQAAVALGADLHHTDPEKAGCAIANRLTEMMRVTGIPNGLSGVGYGPDDIPALTEGAFPQKRLLDNAPLPVSKDQLANLFRDSIRCW